MPQVDFYHLTQSELADALVSLLKKTHVAGKRALIQCPRPAAEGIDEALWSHDPESWLPHGLDEAKVLNSQPAGFCQTVKQTPEC